MRFRRLTAGLVLACSAAVLPACGGTTEKSGVSGDAGASLIRSGAFAYVAVDSDLSSDQWGKVDELLKKFPDRDKWLAELKQSLKESDPSVDYDRDVKDALGPELDVAAVAGTGGKPAYAALTKPDSMEKAKALVRRLNSSQADDDAVMREVDGWLVISSTQAMIDQVLKGSADKSLADDALFKDATAALPPDALAKAYVNGKELNSFLNAYLGASPLAAVGPNPFSQLGLDKLDWIGAAVDAKDDGIRFQAGVNGAGGADVTGAAKPYASTLISGVPDDAIAFITLQGTSTTKQIEGLRQNPQFGPAFRAFEHELGMSLDSVLALFSHEVAFYVRRGAGLPEFSLVLESPDTRQTLATLDKLAARIAEETGTRIYTEQQGGLTVKSIGLSRVTVHWTGFDGRVLLTTGPTGISDYRAGGGKLADSADYKDALDAAGAPDKTGGLVWLNLHDGVQLIRAYLGVSGGDLPPRIEGDLKPLRSLVGYSTIDGDQTKVAAFLQIK
jgi:hypothetical protein